MTAEDAAIVGLLDSCSAPAADLEGVRKAAERRRKAELAYRREIVAAYESGISFAALAAELGLSRQAIRQLVNRASDEEARLQRRLDVLDSRYESLVASMCDRPGTYKRVTAYQNGLSRKLGRKGLAYDPVKVQLRDYAESLLLETLERCADHPSVKLLVAELDEAAAIRKRLTALAETEAFGAPLD